MNEKNYDDIIDLPHYVSKTRPQMSRRDRAAQFSPFAALTGYEDAAEETARLTDNRLIPDEEWAARLDSAVNLILDNIGNNPEITVTYFVQDLKKSGGKYREYTGCVRTFNEYDKILIFKDGTEIALHDIYDIRSEISFRQK